LLFFVISYIFDQVVQQRATQLELDDQRRQVQELGQTKKHLEAEVADLKDRLELEVISKNEESSQSSLYLSL
jgi:cell division protein FtsB